MKSYLEIFFVTAESHECIQYFKMHIDITDDVRNPDEIIFDPAKISSAAVPAIRQNTFISHSTSWRYEYDGSIYLTYLIYSEYIDFGRFEAKLLSLKDMEISKSSAPDRPRPVNITEEHIVSHGMRHLSYLVSHSPDDFFSHVINGKSRLLFSRITPALAVKIY
jgi:hypothetical protein